MRSLLCPIASRTIIPESPVATSAPRGNPVSAPDRCDDPGFTLTSVLPDFEVTQALPNVTFPIGRNWAGNIAVDRPGHPNDTLFFWAWEKQNGSLTADAGESTEPWGIWLNGG